jgi:hypothetical protein
MKRMTLLGVGALCFTGMLYGQEASSNNTKPREMSGTICNAKCVTKVDNVSTCDTGCTDKSGECVLVDDEGNVKKIENPDMAMPHMGKKVKVMAVPTEKQREEMLRIVDISNRF